MSKKQGQKFEESTIHASTVKKTKAAYAAGTYYNSSYEIENFIQVFQDEAKGNPFKVLNDPTWTGFKLFFHFTATSGLLAEETNVNSALAYLKRIGQNARYELLKRFIETLSKVNSITPWMFQDIEGLQDAWSRKHSDILYDKELTINTLETIDGKIGSLVKMYRDISFDYVRWTHVLPVNLRRFSMSIYVYDFRMFDNGSETAKDFLQTLDNVDIKRLNHTMFDLGYCQFTNDSGKEFFETISNNPKSENTNNLTIKFEAIDISSLFRSITGSESISSRQLAKELVVVSTTPTDAASSIDNSNTKIVVKNGVTYRVKTIGGIKTSDVVDRLSSTALGSTIIDKYDELTSVEAWKTKLGNVEENTEASIAKKIESALTGLYLGNIHGFGFADILKLAENQNGFKETFIDTYSLLPQNNSLAFGKSTSSNLGNANN